MVDTARKRAPKAAASTPTDAAAEGSAAPEQELEAADPEPEQEPSAPPQPVKRYAAPKPAPIRAGGHVLTERGWVLDTTPEQEH